MEAMNRTHHHAPSPSAEADLAAELRARGRRLTNQREQVLAAVRDLRHATPEQISEAVTGVDVTTVYRTLELLEEIGLAAHPPRGHGAPFYRPPDDQHGHIVCHVCGRVTDTDPVLIEDLAQRLLA